MTTLKKHMNIENLVCDQPDYVMKAIIKWFENIPKEELDRPIIGHFCVDNANQVYTPRQLCDEMMQTLKIDFSFKQRAKSVAKMTDVSKDLLTEIIMQYGNTEKQSL